MVQSTIQLVPISFAFSRLNRNNQDFRWGEKHSSQFQNVLKGVSWVSCLFRDITDKKSTKHRLAVYTNYTLDNLVKSFFFFLSYGFFLLQFLRLKQQKYQSSFKYEEE